MEEVGCPEKGQEDLGPPHRHLHPKGERPEGVGHYQGLPREEGGVVDEARACTACDGARVKALVWFWLIDETLSANLVCQSVYEIGSTF
jgi:hypothetical protein